MKWFPDIRLTSRMRHFILISGVLLGVSWIASLLFGTRLIQAAYEQRSFGFLNDMLAGRATHPLAYYTELGSRFLILFSVLFGLSLFFLLLFILPAGSLSWPAWHRWINGHTRSLNDISDKHLWAWIALAAGTSLFLELMMIRIHSSYFQLFAYFKNISLLSCFLGLGIGFMRDEKRMLALPLVVPGLALQVGALYGLRFSGVADMLQNPISEQLTLGLAQLSTVENAAIGYAFLLSVFLLNALCFIPLGQLSARLMSRLPGLQAYGWNLGGSLLGILLFTLLSFLWTPPPVWLVVGFILTSFFLMADHKSLLTALGSLILIVGLLAIPFRVNQYDFYSPYQILTLALSPKNLPILKTSNAYYQRILDLDDTRQIQSNPARHYQMPYRFKPAPNSVLVVGSGMGNDVTAALRQGANVVDAVEIDPAIVEFGKQLHPGKPYASGRVRVHINDARAFFRTSHEQYDLIVYGLLDAHTLLSGVSGGVRLDSYVYTVEGLREARQRLTPDGILCLSFCILNPALGKKLYLMLEEAFDNHPPLVYQTDYDKGYAFLAGPGLKNIILPDSTDIVDVRREVSNPSLRADKSTDDWPFFYMPVRKYPVSCLFLVAALLFVSLITIRRFGVSVGAGFSAPAFFLGAGFMLIETKGITELALAYGSTWVVISAMIAAIMVMAFFANVAVMKRQPLKPFSTYAFLCFSLLLGYGITHLGFNNLPVWIIKIGLPLVLALPLFFSGFAFSTLLKGSMPVRVALSSNLLGAMLGGFLEYNSMYFGFRALYLIALGMYVLAGLTTVLRSDKIA